MKKKIKKYKENIILDNLKIITAIKILNKVKLKTLIVIDKNNKLIGTLTDGDIRRALLKGHSVNNFIFSIANKKPIKKKIGKKLIKFNGAKIIPLVDKNNKVIKIEVKEKKK